MATLYIAEFSSLAKAGGGDGMQIAQWPPHKQQTVAIGGSSAASAVFDSRTVAIRVHADVICSFRIGGVDETPTALATDARLAADATEYFGVKPNQKIAVITNS